MIKESYSGILWIGSLQIGGAQGMKKARAQELASEQIKALDKLLETAEVKNFLPVLAGSIMQPHFEVSILLELIQVMNKYRPALLPQRAEARGSRYNYMDIISQLGSLELLGDKPVRTTIKSVPIALYGAHGGAPLPTQLRKKNKGKESTVNIVVIRDKVTPAAIANCDMIINGEYSEEKRRGARSLTPSICPTKEGDGSNNEIAVWSPDRRFFTIKEPEVKISNNSSSEIASAVAVDELVQSQFVEMMQNSNEEEEMIEGELIERIGEAIIGGSQIAKEFVGELYEGVLRQELEAL